LTAADAGLTVESRDEQTGLGAVRTGATAGGVLLALAILALTVGLLRSESAGETRTLTAAGAGGGIRRAVAATTAGVLAILAVLGGAAAAYLALVAGYWPEVDRLTNVPVAHLVGIAVAVPLTATLAGWALAGREPAVISRRVLD
jgi:putative ABC transport system permease protein